ncbi:MAG: ABC transporter substrate-binding protein, partial [Ruminococcus sp.]|nr:ABC transporter substrate-binding protein [Ruminococcus sp.]
NFYEPLVKYKNGEYVPCLATEWSTSDDGLTYTFKLREDVKFNDGTDFNAQAVKLYFDNMRPTLGASTNYGQLDTLVTEVTADDDYTVSFHLSRPYYNVLNDISMAMPRGILSPAAFNEDGTPNEEYLMEHTPGTGPYMFASANDTATEYKFVRNPNYWGDAPDADGFTVKVIPETKVAAMKAGEVDFIIGSETLDAASYLELSQAEGITGEVSDFNFVTEFIALNDEVPGLDDINVRNAIQMAIDKASVAENIYSGLRTPADSVMPADMPFCKFDTKTPGYNFDEAVKLLEDSGWKDSDGNGIRDKDGTELSYTITYPATGVYDDVVLYYQQTMQELGIEVKTDPLDLMTFFDKIFSQTDYEMTAYISYWFPYDPYTFVANMYPSTDYTAADGIYSTDPQVAKALATMSEAEAKDLIKGLYTYDDSAKIQEIFTKALDSANESSVVIPLNYRNEYAVYNSDKIASYTFNSIPNHVDVSAIKLK